MSPAVLHGLLVKITFCKVNQYAASVINSAISFALSDVYIEYTYIKLSF